MGTNFYWRNNKDDEKDAHIGKRWGGLGVCHFIWYRKAHNMQKLKDFDKECPKKKCVKSESDEFFTAAQFLKIIEECLDETESNEEFC